MKKDKKSPKTEPKKLKKSERPEIPPAAHNQLLDYINLVCIICRGNDLVFHHKSGDLALIAMNLKDLLPWLNPKLFMRTHESNILNFSFIIDIQPRGKGLWAIMDENLACKVTEVAIIEFNYRYGKYKEHNRLIYQKQVMCFTALPGL